MIVPGVVAAAVLAVTVAGCGGQTSSPPTSGSTSSKASAPSSAPATSPSVQPTDYTNLLIQATDINAPVPFTGSPPTQNPDGQPGVATAFSTRGRQPRH